MKYHFRPSGKKSKFLIKKGTKLVLAGKGKPKKVRPLPLPNEKIIFSEELRQKKKSGLIPAIKRFGKRIALGLSAFGTLLLNAARTVKRKIKELFSRLSAFMSRRRKGKKPKTINSLPVLAGAMTATLLVCAISFLYLAFGLFSFYSRGYETVTVPLIEGKALSEIEDPDEKFDISIKYINNPDIPDGTVISQSPPAGVERRIYKDAPSCNITLTVSKHEKITVPDKLVGARIRDALLTLKNQEIPYKINKVYSETTAADVVISVLPKSGTVLGGGEKVTLTVSLGSETKSVFMPDLLGLSETDAANHLSAVGLVLDKVVYSSSEKTRGTVISQSILKTTSVPIGTKVTVTVSLGDIR